jgi:CheY-like chemotaxis protein
MASILIIDDEEPLRTLLRDILEQAGHAVTDVANGALGVARFRQEPYDLVITDILMPDQEGLETIVEIRQFRPNQQIIAMSGGGRTRSVEFLAVAKTVGANVILAKPFGVAEFRQAVSDCLDQRQPL